MKYKNEALSLIQLMVWLLIFRIMSIIKSVTNIVLIVFICGSCGLVSQDKKGEKLNISTYLEAWDGEHIYPSKNQLDMLKTIIPDQAFQPAPPISDRAYWTSKIATESGESYLEEALTMLDKAPEVPISDSVYRRANKEGNRKIYKPRYYRTMDRLEKYIMAECMENEGRFLLQIEQYIKAIISMKSWMHPNHDDNENSVLEGKRVAIDLGARKFGLVLALAEVLLEDKLSDDLRLEISAELKYRITDSYLKSCKGEDKVGNNWVKSTSNWNAVCTSGTIFTTIVASDGIDERAAAIGCALNSMKYYLSGFGDDGYCSEGTGYWNYGFGHYLYLAQILYDYTSGEINLFEFDNPEKLRKVANFPENFEIQNGLYSRFSDGVLRVSIDNDNFAYLMAARYYDARPPLSFIPDEVVQTLVSWSDSSSYVTTKVDKKYTAPLVTYFDDYGVIISRGQQEVPFSIAVKAGHNKENHNHSDVGSYVIVLGDDMISGDIGAPSYTAGAFSPDNPARSSWGHPLPTIQNKLQSNGANFKGEVIKKSFTEGLDSAVLDIKSAYDIPFLEKLIRVIKNDKSDRGTITVTDTFSAVEPIDFGTAIMVDVSYEIVNENTVVLQSDNQKVLVEIFAEGGVIKIRDEEVPVEHLRSGKAAYRIGVDFMEPIKEGKIVVRYQPVL